MRWGLLLVAALALTAGCSGVLGSQTPAQDVATETVTPVPVPSERATATPTPEPIDYPAGIGPNGLVDRTALRDGHLAALRDRSFTLEVRGLAPDDRGTVQRINQTVVATEDAVLIRTRGSSRQQVYVTENRTYHRRYNASAGGWDAFYTPSRAGTELWRTRVARAPLSYVPTTLTEPTAVERDGRQLLRLFTTEPPPDYERSGSYSATVYVTPSGLLTTVVITFEQTDGSQAQLRFDFRRVGETTVERPAWVDDADPADWLDEDATTDRETASQTPTPRETDATATATDNATATVTENATAGDGWAQRGRGG